MERSLTMILSLKEIYTKYNTESPKKGGDKGTVHSYIENYYETALINYRSSAKTVLEIGINQGHSLMMWNEYFINAEIIGVDIKIPEVNTGCRMICGDATDSTTFNDLGNFDVIIDDGSHKLEHQLLSFNILFPKLNSGGIYIIEDVVDINKTKENFLNLHTDVEIFDFRSFKNRDDDVIVQIIKK